MILKRLVRALLLLLADKLTYGVHWRSIIIINQYDQRNRGVTLKIIDGS